MKPALSAAVVLLCAGCNSSHHRQSDAENIKLQSGRYQLIEAKGAYPAMIFDTATACLEPVYAVTEGKNAGNLQRSGLIGQDSDACAALPVAKNKIESGAQ